MPENNTEATYRIRRELIASRKLEERRDAIMNMFFEITGIPMTSAQFELYNKLFNDVKIQSGYNVKSFIRDQKIIKDSSVMNKAWQDFLEDVPDAQDNENKNQSKSSLPQLQE